MKSFIHIRVKKVNIEAPLVEIYEYYQVEVKLTCQLEGIINNQIARYGMKLHACYTERVCTRV